MKVSGSSLTRFLIVVIISVLGMGFVFSAYIESVSSSNFSEQIFSGLVTVLMVTAYWGTAGILIGRIFADSTTRIWETVFAIVFLLGCAVIFVLRGLIPDELRSYSLLSLGAGIFFGEAFVCAELLRLYMARMIH
jgi:hypothetical protein